MENQTDITMFLSLGPTVEPLPAPLLATQPIPSPLPAAPLSLMIPLPAVPLLAHFATIIEFQYQRNPTLEVSYIWQSICFLEKHLTYLFNEKELLITNYSVFVLYFR